MTKAVKKSKPKLKFKLRAEYIEKYGRKAFKIEALMDFDLPWPFGKVKKGDTGGYIEKESFMTQEGKGWLFDGGEIWGGVIHDGVIRGGEIWGGVIRGGEIWGGVIRGGVIHDGVIRGGEIWGGVIWGGVIRGGEIWGGVIRGGVIWGGEIRGGEDYFSAGSVGSSFGVLCAYRLKDGALEVTRGCFRGSLADFRKAVKDKYGKEDQGKAYLMLADFIEFRFNKLHKFVKKEAA